jgi:hypothetical protein
MSPDLLEERQIGNNDLRGEVLPGGGFNHVALRDADDGDVIIVNEDDLVALRDWLTRVIEETSNG